MFVLALVHRCQVILYECHKFFNVLYVHIYWNLEVDNHLSDFCFDKFNDNYGTHERHGKKCSQFS